MSWPAYNQGGPVDGPALRDVSNFKVPDGVEPVVGWRYWYLDDLVDEGDQPSLMSLHRSESWLPRAAVHAVCQRDVWDFPDSDAPAGHDAPHERCSCGIYAATSLENLRVATGLNYSMRCVVGEVNLWGRVIVADRGYRAEHAYPKSLYIVENEYTDVDAVQRSLAPFGVPVGRKGKEALPAFETVRIIGSMITGAVITPIPSFVQAQQAAHSFHQAMQSITITVKDAAEQMKVFAAKLEESDGQEQSVPPARKNWTRLNTRPKRLLYQTRDQSHFSHGPPR